MINDQIKINSLVNSKIDLNKVKFDDVNTSFTNVLQNICLYSLLNHVLIKSLPFIQMYYLIRSEGDITNTDNYIDDKVYHDNITTVKIFFCCLGFIGLKILYLPTEFINDTTVLKYFEFFKKKKYYHIGELFRNSCLLSLLINFIYFFPFMLLTNLFLDYFVTDQDEIIACISSLQMRILSDKLIAYLNLNFFTLIIYSISKPLQNMLLCFGEKRKILLHNILRFVFVIILSNCISLIDPDFYFLLGLGFTSLFTEILLLISLFTTQHLSNPFPQAWIRISISIIKESLCSNSFKEIFCDLKEFMSYVLYNYFSEVLFMIDIVCGTNSVNSMRNYGMYVFSILCVNLFFDSNRITNVVNVREINNLTDQIPLLSNQRNRRCDNFTSLLTSDKDERNNNLDIMIHIKTVFLGFCLINSTSFFIFLILCYFDAFSMIIDFRLGIAIALSGFVYSISKELYALNKILENKFYFSHFLIGFLISILFFTYVSCFHLMTPFLFILSCYLGNFHHLVVFTKYLRYFDIRVVILEKILKVSHGNYSIYNL